MGSSSRPLAAASFMGSARRSGLAIEGYGVHGGVVAIYRGFDAWLQTADVDEASLEEWTKHVWSIITLSSCLIRKVTERLHCRHGRLATRTRRSRLRLFHVGYRTGFDGDINFCPLSYGERPEVVAVGTSSFVFEKVHAVG